MTDLSLVYITNRPAGQPESEQKKSPTQYDLLAESLKNQSLPRDRWELVVVDEYNQVPRPELSFLDRRVKYVRPAPTPWRKLRYFSPASARNAGLLVAEGDVVFGLDDFTVFDGGLLETILGFAEQDLYLEPVAIGLAERRALDGVVRPQELCGGVVAYPRAAAITVGGHDERFDSCEAFEDWEFSRRMAKVAGVKFVRDNCSKVVLFPHERKTRRLAKCAVLVDYLLRDSQVGNTPWTAEQVKLLTKSCPFIGADKQCQIAGVACRGQTKLSTEAAEIVSGYESRLAGPSRGTLEM